MRLIVRGPYMNLLRHLLLLLRWMLSYLRSLLMGIHCCLSLWRYSSAPERCSLHTLVHHIYLRVIIIHNFLLRVLILWWRSIWILTFWVNHLGIILFIENLGLNTLVLWRLFIWFNSRWLIICLNLVLLQSLIIFLFHMSSFVVFNLISNSWLNSRILFWYFFCSVWSRLIIPWVAGIDLIALLLMSGEWLITVIRISGLGTTSASFILRNTCDSHSNASFRVLLHHHAITLLILIIINHLLIINLRLWFKIKLIILFNMFLIPGPILLSLLLHR